MALNAQQIRSYLWLGFISGIILPFLANFISNNIIKGISVTFSALPATSVSPGFPSSVADFFVKIVSNAGTLPTYILAGIGGALFVLLGAWVYSLRTTPNARTTYGKIFLILFYASIALALVSWWTTGAIAFLPVLLVSTLTSAVTAAFIWILEKINVVKVP